MSTNSTRSYSPEPAPFPTTSESIPPPMIEFRLLLSDIHPQATAQIAYQGNQCRELIIKCPAGENGVSLSIPQPLRNTLGPTTCKMLEQEAQRSANSQLIASHIRIV